MNTIIKNNNKVQLTNGKINRTDRSSPNDGLFYDGANKYVELGNILRFTRLQPFSISIVFNFKSFAGKLYPCIFSIGSSINGNVIYLSSTSNKIVFMQRTGANLADRIILLTTNNIAFNTLYHITITRDITGANKLYVNGILDAQNVYTISNEIAYTTSTKIAYDGDGQFFNGIVYDLKVFNDSLTDADVSYLYNSANKVVPATASGSLVADWRFENRQGAVLTDASGNAYTGALSNYTAAETTLGLNNKWVDINGLPILQL